MSWRTIVISKRAKLDLQLGYMVVRSDILQKVHLSEISTVMIENTGVSLTAALLAELIRRKVKVIFCDEKRNPSAELVPYYGSYDSSSNIRQQIKWDEGTKGIIWTEIVRNKILNQAAVLMKYDKEEAGLLREYISEIECNDATNREGHAAKVYFNSLFGKDFSRSDGNNINAALNYGYSILLSACSREVTANGYITQLGIHHCNVFNLFNLASDLMEVFRPFVDDIVYEIWNRCYLTTFDHEIKMQIISILNNDVSIKGKNYTLDYAVKIYCKHMLDSMSSGDVSDISPCYFKDYKQ